MTEEAKFKWFFA